MDLRKALVKRVAVWSVLGLVGGIIAIRVRGVYFALITFGLAQVVAKVVYNTRSLGASDPKGQRSHPSAWAMRRSAGSNGPRPAPNRFSAPMT